jgi:hypothetical protein
MIPRGIIGNGTGFIVAIAIGFGGVWLAGKFGFGDFVLFPLGIMAAAIPIAMFLGALVGRLASPHH